MWSQIKALTKNVPSPFDNYFDSVTMMAPLYCLRGTEDGLRFFETALKEMEEKVRLGTGPLPEERFRFVIEGPPPWPYLRTFRDMFAKWGAVAVASTYSTVGGIWEFGFKHDPNHPLESIAQHMLQWNVTNRNFLQRYEQIARYIEEWSADALVIHSVKSCRLFSAGQGDMREYFTKELGVPTLSSNRTSKTRDTSPRRSSKTGSTPSSNPWNKKIVRDKRLREETHDLRCGHRRRLDPDQRHHPQRPAHHRARVGQDRRQCHPRRSVLYRGVKAADVKREDVATSSAPVTAATK